MEKIAIAACRTYEKNEVRRAMEELLEQTGALDWVKPGMKIAVKTNLVSGAAPEKAVVTHPVVLAVLSEILIRRGAQVVIGDSPGGPFTAAYVKHVYKLSGMEIAGQAGAVLNMDFGQQQAEFSKGKIMKSLTYTSWLTEADAIIGCCKLKTHGMMGMSANVKNFFGAIPGTMKPEYHYRFPNHEDFADMLVDINEFLKPGLYITDAIVGMEGNGPTSGTPREIGALLASKDPYNLDVVCSYLMGLEPEQVPTIAAAHRRGLCSMDVKQMNILGDPDDFVVPDYKNIRQLRGIDFHGSVPSFLVPVARLVLQSRPRVKKKECIGCKKCASICPAKAITMVNQKPKIDTAKCIRCFCCQEFCPKGAMKVHRTGIARLLNR